MRDCAERSAAVADCVAALDQRIKLLRGQPEIPTDLIDELTAVLADIRANLPR